LKLAVATIYYNDVRGLERLASSICDYVDYWIVIDGKFDLLDSKEDYSTDGSREYLGEIETGTEIIQRDFVGTEHDKRNQYLKVCAEYDIDALLIIDSDEYVLNADWNKFRESIPTLNQNNNLQCVYANFSFLQNKGNYGWYPRLWLRPSEMEYHNAHCIFRNKITGEISNSASVRNNDDLQTIFQLAGDDSLRDKEYLEKTFHYQEKMIQREKKFRDII
jgi:hypothetical protein